MCRVSGAVGQTGQTGFAAPPLLAEAQGAFQAKLWGDLFGPQNLSLLPARPACARSTGLLARG